MEPIPAFVTLLNFGSMQVKPLLDWLSGRVLGRVVQSYVKITRVIARFELRFESLKSISVLILFVYKLMIGSSKNNRQNYARKCFWTQEKETRVKFNPGLSANRPSNNSVLDCKVVGPRFHSLDWTNREIRVLTVFVLQIANKSFFFFVFNIPLAGQLSSSSMALKEGHFQRKCWQFQTHLPIYKENHYLD